MDLFNSFQFESHVQQLMRQHLVPGLSIAIVQNDQIVSAGFGSASLESSKPCTPHTLFDIASSAKSLTAASVALLVDDDKNYPEVQYDAIMSHLLPDDFVMSGVGYTEGITVEDVLSHRTGMAGHNNSYMGSRAAHPDNAQSITRNLRNLPVAVPLRSRYLYCNMMFTVATHLVEVKSQKSFSDFLHERIFEPLGMQSTTLQPESARTKGFGDRMAKGYIWNKDGAAYHGLDSPDCPESQGAGSIISSANDFIKWVKALMNCEHPINEKVYRGLLRMRSIVNPNARRLKPYTSPAIYTAGMEVYYYRGQMVVGHDGNIPGFSSRFIFLPFFKFGAVIMGNSSGAGPVFTQLMKALMEEILQVPEAERSFRGKMKTVHGAIQSDLPINIKAHSQDQAQGQHKHQLLDQFRNDPQAQSNDKSQGQIQKNDKDKRTHKGEDMEKDKTKGQRKNLEKPQQARNLRDENSPPQETSLNEYVGKYWHPGYHTITVDIKDGKLFVDATDRSMGFILKFEHIHRQTKYIAHLSDFLEGGDDPVDAEFVFKGGKVEKLGLDLEPAVKQMIWFEREKES